jgi:hypothetical protein
MLFMKSAKADRTVIAKASHLNNKHGPWWNDRGLRTLDLLIFIPLMSMFKDTIPALSTMFSSCRHGRKVTTSIPTIEVVSVTDFIAEFNSPSGSLLGILSASYWVGNLFGVFAIAPLSD